MPVEIIEILYLLHISTISLSFTLPMGCIIAQILFCAAICTASGVEKKPSLAITVSFSESQTLVIASSTALS